MCGSKDGHYLCTCRHVVYCSQKCQAQDWPKHKFVCTFGGRTLQRNKISNSVNDVSQIPPPAASTGSTPDLALGSQRAVRRADTIGALASLGRGSSDASILNDNVSFYLGTRRVLARAEWTEPLTADVRDVRDAATSGRPPRDSDGLQRPIVCAGVAAGTSR